MKDYVIRYYRNNDCHMLYLSGRDPQEVVDRFIEHFYDDAEILTVSEVVGGWKQKNLLELSKKEDK